MGDNKCPYPEDRCFELEHATTSHPWIFDDCRPQEPPASVYRHTFQPFPVLLETRAVREKILYDKVWDEVVADMVAKQKTKFQVEEYCTEYNGNYGGRLNFTGFRDDEEYMERIKVKYPLYSSPPFTVYRHFYALKPPAKVLVPSRSPNATYDNLWRKKAVITIPPGDLLDEPPGGL